MANRILRESICTSGTIDRLSYFEEVCFYRLLVQCDDFGRMDARPAVLRSRLFPLREDVESKAIMQAIARLEEVNLLVVYEYDGQPFLQVCTWEKHQRVRNKRAKYPSPFPEEQPTDNV
ncbi:MAG: hypothetical protein IJP14_00475 [Clostridia bacterium]|nr:hypothetical protein [Clostridia bacterium]